MNYATFTPIDASSCRVNINGRELITINGTGAGNRAQELCTMLNIAHTEGYAEGYRDCGDRAVKIIKGDANAEKPAQA